MTDPYDEHLIESNDNIIRRINPDEHVVWDDNLKCRRLSSKAFTASSEPNGGMSVDIERLIVSAGLDPRRFVTTPVYTGSVSFTAGSVRAAGLLVGFEPLPENRHHGEVWAPGGAKFKKTQKRALQRASTWYVEIEGVAVT